MEVLEQSRAPGDGMPPAGEPMNIDAPTKDSLPLTNGHTYKEPSPEPTHAPSAPEPVPAVKETIQETLVPAAVNGEPEVAPAPISTAGSTLISTSTISDPLSSSQPSITENIAIRASSPAVDLAPAVVQQPTSDIREEAVPADPERGAEIIARKQGEDLAPLSAVPDTPTTTETPAVNAAERAEPEEPAPLSATSESDPAVSSVPAPATQETVATDVGETQPADPVAEIKTTDIPDHPPVPIPEGATTETPIDPAPSPKSQESVTASAPTQSDEPADQVMEDAPPAQVKVARERDEDEAGDEPLAKRAKTEEETPTSAEFKKPEIPAVGVNGTQATETAGGVKTITAPQQKHLLKIIGNVKRINAAKMFTVPVDHVAMNLPTYPTIVTNPMDLRTLEDNLRADKYSTAEDAIADFNRIVDNSKLFNGVDHPVTQNALTMKVSFDKALEKLPGPDVTEVNAGDRKKKASEPGPVKIPPPRRESRSSLPGSARSPASASSPQTFALSPEGVPLIRRDSTVDGRPKREIHRPAPRDLPYSNQKPKKKKYQLELKFCEKVLSELSKAKYASYNYPFMAPVDPVALNIPTYHNVVKKPMDFGTMKQKLDRGEYENAKDFESDARLVFQNCYKFNPPGDIIHNTGREFEKVFDLEWAKKKEWLENNTPASGPQSPGSSPEPDDSEEDEEEEEDDEEEDQVTELSKLQKHIAELSKQVEAIQQKKKKSPPATSKKAKSKPSKKESKKSSASAPAKSEKKSAPKAKKEKAPTVSYEQKQDISLRINSLSENKMATALKIIRDNMPNLKGVQDDELELDIDELSNDVLYKLLVFVRKHAPRPDDSPARPAATTTSSTAAPSRKKNKPMSKHEQEARIAQVQNSLSAYNQGSPPAQTSRGGQDDESSDRSDSSSSEEE